MRAAARTGRRTGIVLALACLLGSAGLCAAESSGRRSRSKLSREDYKAKDMLERGLEALKAQQEDRGVKLISSVPRMFPKSPMRFEALMALGRFRREKRDFDLAIKQFAQVKTSPEKSQQAEALYEIGICHYGKNSYEEAFKHLRKVTTDYPWTVFANEAYYYIGLCHFRLRRWSRSVKALQMVGASVPTNVEEGLRVEAGQRFYVKVVDQDLAVLKARGGAVTVSLETTGGDAERVKLKPFGEGAEYLGSIKTEAASATTGDRILQIAGGDVVEVRYVDENTEDGTRDRKLLAKGLMVSTASAGFTDGAYREYTDGVFANGESFVRVR
ncbi:MAG: tetratricopeptide repeat protein, partial [Planctomycetota bacterium]